MLGLCSMATNRSGLFGSFGQKLTIIHTIGILCKEATIYIVFSEHSFEPAIDGGMVKTAGP